MRIVFAGTPDFAATVLRALLEAAADSGWSLPLVLTQPDRPAGRGLQLAPSPVKQLALEHGLQLDSPASLRQGPSAQAALDRLREIEPDLLVVAAYGLILPPAVLQIPRGLRNDWPQPLTAVNVHASLLPRWRGAAPVVRAIEAGDAVTGITIMQMDAGLDTGPMLLSEALPIEPCDTAGRLTARLAVLGGRTLVQALQSVDKLQPVPQPEHASYAAKVAKNEAAIDWALAALEIERKLRAFDPFPGATGVVRATPLRLWRADVVPGSAAGERPGTVVGVSAEGIAVACGSGTLVLRELQRPGGRRLHAADFLRGFPIAVGDRFERAAT